MNKLEKILSLKMSKPSAYYCCECGNVRVIRNLSSIGTIGKQGHFCLICNGWREYEKLDSVIDRGE